MDSELEIKKLKETNNVLREYNRALEDYYKSHKSEFRLFLITSFISIFISALSIGINIGIQLEKNRCTKLDSIEMYQKNS
jgi:hypothetical protein